MTPKNDDLNLYFYRLPKRSILRSFFICLFFNSLAFPAKAEQRVVSLAPSLTEIIYALGSESKLVGVSSHCDYPLAAKKIQQVGSLTDVNLELVLAVKPTVVLTLAGHEEVRRQLSLLGIESLTFDHDSIAGVLSSIAIVARELGKTTQGKALTLNFKQQIATISQENTLTCKEQRILISLGNAGGDGPMDSLYVVGRATLYEELLSLLSCKNAATDIQGYGVVSPEGVIEINPDIILDLSQAAEDSTADSQLRRWSRLPLLKAVKRKRVHVLKGEYLLNPGPRIPLTLKALASALRAKE